MGMQDRFTDEFKRDAVAQVVDRGYRRQGEGIPRPAHQRRLALSVDRCHLSGGQARRADRVRRVPHCGRGERGRPPRGSRNGNRDFRG
jgi:hypothetical protein